MGIKRSTKHETLAIDAVNQLTFLKNNVEQERAHSEADDILCSILKELGFSDVVEAFEKMDKWYA